MRSGKYIHVLYELYFSMGSGWERRERKIGWGRGMYLCVWGWGGGGGEVANDHGPGLHSREITTVCEITCMTIIQYRPINNEKAF